ncbi:MAG: winged helix-turn-helix transcriptional regulator [Alphaproteobacteria bacterium]|nr:winged helix-turn-helix transcriptional regulator [Alphaproteobacteria bacterium]
MWRTIAIYGVALAAGAFVLQWLQYQYLARTMAPEFYVVLIALGFTALGIWAGNRLTPRTVARDFQRNEAALKTLGVTEREVAVLELLAAGSSNKEIARQLDISPNTVKTHIASLFAKLEVQRRTQAIQKARELKLLP